ncbi:DUF808 domain-containing protein [Halioxenophilus sp. WMMB6]|uniref:DUF808 domain-containing protein n=1 Tax=Halioxenophilus sp. WMMB6 TaxID=3073815 RepID=UPI00295F0334|nr:DUF808 domain-containing protein [Halioxenophilus sp. WMMB6]
MAFAGLLALLDDIATVLDDVSVMTKVAAKKTAGVLGDDLALNAEQVSGIRAERELPVVWAVFVGSCRNKCILVPAALLISAFIPWLITPLLMLGGAFLCFEGFEKVFHSWLHPSEASQRGAVTEALHNPTVNMAEFEREKIKGAVRTDFILSAEVVVIALGTVAEQNFLTQLGVVVVIAALITVGVYGIVAAIVKLDDLGLLLAKPGAAEWRYRLGRWILAICPYVIKLLTIVGTAAMFLVGGGILLHGLPIAHGLSHWLDELTHTLPAAGLWAAIASALANALLGILAGGLLVAGKTVIDQLRAPRQ